MIYLNFFSNERRTNIKQKRIVECKNKDETRAQVNNRKLKEEKVR